jgi:hypothetical protein
MKKLLQALFTYCSKNGIELSIPRKEGSKGFIIYDTSTVTDLAKLSALAKACNFECITIPKSYNSITDKLQSERLYVGLVSRTTITDDDRLGFATSFLD